MKQYLVIYEKSADGWGGTMAGVESSQTGRAGLRTSL